MKRRCAYNYVCRGPVSNTHTHTDCVYTIDGNQMALVFMVCVCRPMPRSKPEEAENRSRWLNPSELNISSTCFMSLHAK